MFLLLALEPRSESHNFRTKQVKYFRCCRVSLLQDSGEKTCGAVAHSKLRINWCLVVERDHKLLRLPGGCLVLRFSCNLPLVLGLTLSTSSGVVFLFLFLQLVLLKCLPHPCVGARQFSLLFYLIMIFFFRFVCFVLFLFFFVFFRFSI